jgi:hypothetical protein
MVKVCGSRTLTLLHTYGHLAVDTLVQVVAVGQYFMISFQFIHLFAKSHSEGEKCVIVSGTSGPGPSTIKVWSHKPVSIPRYTYIALRI